MRQLVLVDDLKCRTLQSDSRARIQGHAPIHDRPLGRFTGGPAPAAVPIDVDEHVDETRARRRVRRDGHVNAHSRLHGRRVEFER